MQLHTWGACLPRPFPILTHSAPYLSRGGPAPPTVLCPVGSNDQAAECPPNMLSHAERSHKSAGRPETTHVSLRGPSLHREVPTRRPNKEKSRVKHYIFGLHRLLRLVSDDLPTGIGERMDSRDGREANHVALGHSPPENHAIIACSERHHSRMLLARRSKRLRILYGAGQAALFAQPLLQPSLLQATPP